MIIYKLWVSNPETNHALLKLIGELGIKHTVDVRGNPYTGIMEIYLKVCEISGVSSDMMRSRRRDRKFVIARTAFSVISSKCGFTQTSIASMLKRDHSTIVHHLRYWKDSGALDQDLSGLVTSTAEQLKLPLSIFKTGKKNEKK